MIIHCKQLCLFVVVFFLYLITPVCCRALVITIPCQLFFSSDFAGLPLRGHNKGVTDILFSVYNPLMFSVSKDATMRAWKASDYTCGAIYR